MYTAYPSDHLIKFSFQKIKESALFLYYHYFSDFTLIFPSLLSLYHLLYLWIVSSFFYGFGGGRTNRPDAGDKKSLKLTINN
jgi:hypothetical protein